MAVKLNSTLAAKRITSANAEHVVQTAATRLAVSANQETRRLLEVVRQRNQEVGHASAWIGTKQQHAIKVNTTRCREEGKAACAWLPTSKAEFWSVWRAADGCRKRLLELPSRHGHGDA